VLCNVHQDCRSRKKTFRVRPISQFNYFFSWKWLIPNTYFRRKVLKIWNLKIFLLFLVLGPDQELFEKAGFGLDTEKTIPDPQQCSKTVECRGIKKHLNDLVSRLLSFILVLLLFLIFLLFSTFLLLYTATCFPFFRLLSLK
jgi:hypothetical protein